MSATSATDRVEAIRWATKQKVVTTLTVPEAHRFEALAREHHGLPPATLLRRLVLQELQRTSQVEVSRPYPDTLT